MRQSSALDILQTGQNVFFSVFAGSGKTYTLNQYINYLRARRVPVAVTASTGIAATHMNGTTIHSWSGIGIKDELSERDLSTLARKQFLADRLKETAVLIIDEINRGNIYKIFLWIISLFKISLNICFKLSELISSIIPISNLFSIIILFERLFILFLILLNCSN